MIDRFHYAVASVFTRLQRSERGATAVEYGLIVGLIAVVLVVAIAALSGALGDMFKSVTDTLNGVSTPPPTDGD